MKITNERMLDLLNKDDYSINDLESYTAEERLVACWKFDGIAILKYIDTLLEIPHMSYDDFLSRCTACGGNWSAMLLSGIKDRYPIIYNLIPAKMGTTGNEAFFTLCELLNLLNIYTE